MLKCYCIIIIQMASEKMHYCNSITAQHFLKTILIFSVKLFDKVDLYILMHPKMVIILLHYLTWKAFFGAHFNSTMQFF